MHIYMQGAQALLAMLWFLLIAVGLTALLVASGRRKTLTIALTVTTIFLSVLVLFFSAHYQS